MEERKLKPISQNEARNQELTNCTMRFLEEIDRICEEGRVKSMTALEKDLMLRPGKISEYERGRVMLDVFTLHRAKKIYNVDTDYVLHGFANPEISGPIRMGRRLDIHKPFNRKEKNRRSKSKQENQEAD